MNITVYRHEQYNKWIISIDRNFSVSQITIYDISVKELAIILKEIEKEVSQ